MVPCAPLGWWIDQWAGLQGPRLLEADSAWRHSLTQPRPSCCRYNDALLTAHFEVPGEMFTLAMEARAARDGGVVGSTQNILDFIAAKLQDALGKPFPERLQVGHCQSATAVLRARLWRALLQEL